MYFALAVLGGCLLLLILVFVAVYDNSTEGKC